MKRIFTAILFSFFLLVSLLGGIFVTAWGFIEFLEAKESASWPSTAGMITRSQVSEKHDKEDGTTFKAIITYDYTINDKVLTGEKIKYGGTATSAIAADNMVRKYPINSKVLVYYNPDDHSKTVLEPGHDNSIWLLPGFGLAMIFIQVPLIAGVGLFVLIRN